MTKKMIRRVFVPRLSNMVHTKNRRLGTKKMISETSIQNLCKATNLSVE